MCATKKLYILLSKINWKATCRCVTPQCFHCINVPQIYQVITYPAPNNLGPIRFITQWLNSVNYTDPKSIYFLYAPISHILLILVIVKFHFFHNFFTTCIWKWIKHKFPGRLRTSSNNSNPSGVLSKRWAWIWIWWTSESHKTGEIVGQLPLKQIKYNIVNPGKGQGAGPVFYQFVEDCWRWLRGYDVAEARILWQLKQEIAEIEETTRTLWHGYAAAVKELGAKKLADWKKSQGEIISLYSWDEWMGHGGSVAFLATAAFFGIFLWSASQNTAKFLKKFNIRISNFLNITSKIRFSVGIQSDTARKNSLSGLLIVAWLTSVFGYRVVGSTIRAVKWCYTTGHSWDVHSTISPKGAVSIKELVEIKAKALQRLAEKQGAYDLAVLKGGQAWFEKKAGFFWWAPEWIFLAAPAGAFIVTIICGAVIWVVEDNELRHFSHLKKEHVYIYGATRLYLVISTIVLGLVTIWPADRLFLLLLWFLVSRSIGVGVYFIIRNYVNSRKSTSVVLNFLTEKTDVYMITILNIVVFCLGFMIKLDNMKPSKPPEATKEIDSELVDVLDFSTPSLPTNWQFSFQDGASELMLKIISLHHDVMAILVFVVVFVFIVLLRAVFLFKADNFTNKRLNFQHHILLEQIWTIVPAIILVLIALPSFALLYSADEVIEPGQNIKAEGHQWYWNYQFISQFGDLVEHDSYTTELVLNASPTRLLSVDVPLILNSKKSIRLLITSADVLHSWTVPALGVKTDACPGRLNQLAIAANSELGHFFGQCSELCGIGHGFMSIEVIITA